MQYRVPAFMWFFMTNATIFNVGGLLGTWWFHSEPYPHGRSVEDTAISLWTVHRVKQGIKGVSYHHESDRCTLGDGCQLQIEPDVRAYALNEVEGTESRIQNFCGNVRLIRFLLVVGLLSVAVGLLSTSLLTWRHHRESPPQLLQGWACGEWIWSRLLRVTAATLGCVVMSSALSWLIAVNMKYGFYCTGNRSHHGLDGIGVGGIGFTCNGFLIMDGVLGLACAFVCLKQEQEFMAQSIDGGQPGNSISEKPQGMSSAHHFIMQQLTQERGSQRQLAVEQNVQMAGMESATSHRSFAAGNSSFPLHLMHCKQFGNPNVVPATGWSFDPQQQGHWTGHPSSPSVSFDPQQQGHWTGHPSSPSGSFDPQQQGHWTGHSNSPSGAGFSYSNSPPGAGFPQQGFFQR